VLLKNRSRGGSPAAAKKIAVSAIGFGFTLLKLLKTFGSKRVEKERNIER